MGYFIDKSRFEEYGAQNYLVFQPIKRYFKINGKYISSWKSKGLSDETITPYATSDNSLTPLIDYYDRKVGVKFNKGCLKQPNKLTYDYGRKVNIYIVYKLGASSSNDSDSTLKNWQKKLQQKKQILENMGIVVMALDLVEDEASHTVVVDLVKMY